MGIWRKSDNGRECTGLAKMKISPHYMAFGEILCDALPVVAGKNKNIMSSVLELVPHFVQSRRRMERLSELLYALLVSDCEHTEDVLVCLELACSTLGRPEFALITMSRWLNEYKTSVEWNKTTTALLSRMTKLLSIYGWCDESSTVLENFIEFTDDNTFDKIVDCIAGGLSPPRNDKELSQLNFLFMSILGKSPEFTQSRRHEQKAMEFMDFYCQAVNSYSAICPESPGIQESYKPIAALAPKFSKNLRLKAYQALFCGSRFCKEILEQRLQLLFREYGREYTCCGDGIDDARRAEVIYALRCLALLDERSMVDKLKFELNDLLICMDTEILLGVKKCFRVLFECN